MPVQKSRKTPSKRGMHRSHDGLAKPALSVDPQSGETHLRHRITPDGFYRGKRVIEKPAEDADEAARRGSSFSRPLPARCAMHIHRSLLECSRSPSMS